MGAKKNVLVLGSTGMLGSVVSSFFRKDPAFETFSTCRVTSDGGTAECNLDFDADAFVANPESVELFKTRRFDYVINCIGIIKPFCKDGDPAGVRRAIRINALFPHLLAQRLNGTSRVIQIATDCVYSGMTGAYSEASTHDALDVYGKSKSLGEVHEGDFLNIRCSIIGPEQGNRQRSLVEWFLSNLDGTEVKGFTHHLWNGVTTLQFAELCAQIIKKDLFLALVARSRVHHFVPNEIVNKAQLLRMINQVYGRNIRIAESDSVGPAVDRTISSSFNMIEEIYPKAGMLGALEAMRKFR